MSGKRLLDALQFLNVAKSVATKHLAVRQRQLDVYTRTSSLTKGVKNQAEGFTATAQAAAALARRFNEPSAPSASTPPDRTNTTSERPREHDAHRSPSLSSEGAKRLQRQAEFQIPASTTEHSTLGRPDGLNISKQQDVFYEPSQTSNPDLSSLPRVKLPHSTSEVQTSVERDINADVFQAPADEPSEKPAQGELPEEMMKDLFHSPKVARNLTGKGAGSSDWRTSRYGKPAAEQNASRPRMEHSQPEQALDLGRGIAEDASADTTQALKKEDAYKMIESRIPSSRLGRLWQYSGLATSMAFGAVGETVRRVSGNEGSGSIMFSAGNMERLVAKLSKMRGAALKLGQMLSFQGLFTWTLGEYLTTDQQTQKCFRNRSSLFFNVSKTVRTTCRRLSGTRSLRTTWVLTGGNCSRPLRKSQWLQLRLARFTEQF